MERIEQTFITLAPNVRTLQENTAKHSEGLQDEENKAKEDGEKPRGVDSSLVTSDGTTMSNDLMGSMDPDMFGHGKKRFRRPDDEEEDSLEPSEEEEERPLPRLSDMLDLVPMSQRALPTMSGRYTHDTEDPLDARTDPDKLKYPVADAVEVEPPPPPEPPVLQAQGEIAVVSDTMASTAAPSPATVELPVPEPPAARSDSEMRSLLEAEEGYLIAGPARQQSKKKKGFDLVNPWSTLPPAIAEVLNGLVHAPEAALQADRVRRSLARFGMKILSQCRMFGTRVLVVSEVPSQVVPSLQVAGETRYDRVASAYFAADRLCYLQAQRLDDDDEFGDRTILTFASALDHAIGEENFASRHSPAVQASYQACIKGEPGHALVDGFCGTSPLHYFAQGVAAWMSQPGRTLEQDDEQPDVYCSRSMLYDLDRSLYSYLEYLLRDTCRDG